MRIQTHRELIDTNQDPRRNEVIVEIQKAVMAVVWPLGAEVFSIAPVGHGNGVSEVKRQFALAISDLGWLLEQRFPLPSMSDGAGTPGKIDATRRFGDGLPFVVEWETGNISSSHRAVNKMALGLMDGVISGGVLILPTRKLGRYLTDRIGNFEELEPYFRLWRSMPVKAGYLAVMGVEYDWEDSDVPLLPKGTDGRALR